MSGADYDRRTPLHVAASEGNLEAVVHLLQCGASVHVRDRSGATPLHCAVQFQRLDCVRCLVDCGAHLITAPAQLGTSDHGPTQLGKSTTAPPSSVSLITVPTQLGKPDHGSAQVGKPYHGPHPAR